MPLRLVTIPVSHYAEKARWALDRAGWAYTEDGHLPVAHVPAVLRAGGKRMVPVLATPHGAVCDSTEILRFVDRGLAAEARLFPVDAALGAEVERWEERFDAELGPATRRWAYAHLLPARAVTIGIMRLNGPALERALAAAAYPLVAAVIRRNYGVDEVRAARSLDRVRALFAEVSAKLADGRRFLVGDRFTAADLTFAALATPVVWPAEHARFLGGVEALPAAMRAVIDELRATPAGAYALRLYAEERARKLG